MNGQVSLEALLLAIIFLVVLAILLPTINLLYQGGQVSAARMKHLVSKRILEERINEVCYLGDGNARVVYLPASYNGSLNSDCPLERPEIIPNRVVVRNEGGTVKIES
jgi:hypothetical protein